MYLIEELFEGKYKLFIEIYYQIDCVLNTSFKLVKFKQLLTL